MPISCSMILSTNWLTQKPSPSARGRVLLDCYWGESKYLGRGQRAYAPTNSPIFSSTSFTSGKRSRAFFEKTFFRLRKTSNDPVSPGAIVTPRSCSS
jgi:hypothetical protein